MCAKYTDLRMILLGRHAQFDWMLFLPFILCYSSNLSWTSRVDCGMAQILEDVKLICIISFIQKGVV